MKLWNKNLYVSLTKLARRYNNLLTLTYGVTLFKINVYVNINLCKVNNLISYKINMPRGVLYNKLFGSSMSLPHLSHFFYCLLDEIPLTSMKL